MRKVPLGMLALFGLGLAGPSGCTGTDSGPRAQGRAPFAADGAPRDRAVGEGGTVDSGCPLPFEGCCDGEMLWWCQQGQLKSLDCRDRPRCGWSNSKLYDCGTSGVQDPTGTMTKECSLLGVKLPPSDGGPTEAGGGPCQGLAREGCCAGQQLFYCDQGELKSVSCALNPLCGWRAAGQLYDCGTEGGSDPSGRFPMKCPDGLAGDTGPGLGDPSAEAARDRGPGEQGDAWLPGTNCSCQLGVAPRQRAWLLPLALLLLVLGVALRPPRELRSGRSSAPSGELPRPGSRRRC